MRAILLSAVLMLPAVCCAGDPPATDNGDPVTKAERAEKQAEVDLAVGAVRLTLLRARTRLAKGQYDEAVDQAIEGFAAVEKLPASVDRASLVEPLEAVMAEARNKRDGAPKEADASGAAAPGDRAAGSAWPGSQDVGTQIERCRRTKPLGTDGAGALERVGESRELPQRIMIYPDDWPQRTARRSQHSDGILYKGEPFRDENGEIKQTIVYDIQSLLMPMPRYFDLPPMDLRVTTREIDDRAALRGSSGIFTGYANDLARGVGLLPYFGGIGGIGYTEPVDRQAQEELMRMVREVLEGR